MAFSPQADYTDRETATCRRNFVPTFTATGVPRGQSGGSPTVVYLSFLDLNTNYNGWCRLAPVTYGYNHKYHSCSEEYYSRQEADISRDNMAINN
jgi:hypothetical protein